MTPRRMMEDMLAVLVKQNLERQGMKKVQVVGFSRDFAKVWYRFEQRPGQMVGVVMESSLAFPEKLGPSEN